MLAVKNPPADARDMKDLGSIPGWGRSPGEGSSYPLQYSCLENPTYREAWRATVHSVLKSLTQLKQLSRHAVNISGFAGSTVSIVCNCSALESEKSYKQWVWSCSSKIFRDTEERDSFAFHMIPKKSLQTFFLQFTSYTKIDIICPALN